MRVLPGTRTKWVILCAGIVTCIIAMGLALWWHTPGVVVTVHNKTGGPIHDVRLSYTGGESRTAEIARGNSINVVVRPSGESDVRVSFEDSTGKPREYIADVYLERGYRGEIDIVIEEDAISMQHDVRRRRLLHY